MNPTSAQRKQQLIEQFDVPQNTLDEFDNWMTRELNCLAGRWIKFSTGRIGTTDRNGSERQSLNRSHKEG